MRLFVALELPRDLQRRLAEIGKRVDPSGTRARWVGEGALHLTLRFLGETGSDRMRPLVDALGQIVSARLRVRIRGVGFFPGPRAARVVWAGVECDGIGRLRNQVGSATEPLGFRHDSRPFHPHVTLARTAGKRTMDGSLTRMLEPMREEDLGEFEASAFVLFSSRLGAGGAIYEKQAEFPFLRKQDEQETR